MDGAEEAKSEAEHSTFVANPSTARGASLKEQIGSNKHLLGSDPTQAGNRMIAGVLLYVSPSVSNDTIWGIPKPYSIFVLRQGASVVRHRHQRLFTRDRVAVRATSRASFGFTYPAAVVKVTITA